VVWHAASVRTFYVGEILISPAVAQKIQAKHGVTSDEVRELYGLIVPGVWNNDPKRGRRLYVKFRSSTGQNLKIVLQPVDVPGGTWRLRTAIAAR
jgi:hypothetical protein